MGAVRTGMAFENGLQAVVTQTALRFLVRQEILKFRLEIVAVACHPVVLARGKQVLLVSPGRTEQRNTASQSLKNADRRNTAQVVRVLAPGNVQGSFAGPVDR